MAETGSDAFAMMGEATGPSMMPDAMAPSSSDHSNDTALLNERQALVGQLNDAANAAYAQAAAIDDKGDPELIDMKAKLMTNGAQLSGLAGTAASMPLDRLRQGGLTSVLNTGQQLINQSKVERTEATSDLVKKDAEYAAINGTSNDYYNASQFQQRAYDAQNTLRAQLERDGMYTASTDAYLNSGTEAQWRTFEQDLKARYPDVDPELLHKVKFQQLDAESREAQQEFERTHGELAGKMKNEYGALLQHAERTDVPDDEIRHSLAIVDANKFLDLAEKNDVLAKAARGEAISEAEKATLNEEQKRALAFFESDEYKNMTPEEREAFKRDVGQAADAIEANKKAASQNHEKEFAKFQEDLKKMEEEMRAQGKSEAEIKQAVEAKLKEYGDRFEQEPKARARDKEQEQEQAKATEQQAAQGTPVDALSDHQKVEIMQAAAAIRGETGQTSAAASQVHEIQASASSVATQEPAKEYNRTDFAQLFAGSEISSLLASMGVTGGQDIGGAPNLNAPTVQNAQYVAQMHEALNEEQSRA